MHDEELAAGRIGHHAARHAEDAAVMLEVVLGKAVVLELALDAVAGAAHAGALRIAALYHEAGDDPVENKSVVEAAVYEAEEIVYGIRCNFGVQLGLDHAAVFHFNGYYRVWHLTFVLSLMVIRPVRPPPRARLPHPYRALSRCGRAAG